MNDMILKTYIPDKLLQPYISRFFVFETKSGIPKTDLSLIAPTGEVKLVIPYKNNMTSTINNVVREHKESSCFIIGPGTNAADIECDKDYGNICVVFKPFGAYKFFDFPLGQISGQIYDVSDLLNRAGKELQEKVAATADISQKVRWLEEFLFSQMTSLDRFDPLTEYAVGKIISSSGLITIHDLSEYTGCSRRHLANKFTENVGLSPKEIASIIRFNEVYKHINLNKLSEEKLYDLYYDQSHFIKEFKKYTGLTPGEYVSQSNRLGSIFFKD